MKKNLKEPKGLLNGAYALGQKAYNDKKTIGDNPYFKVEDYNWGKWNEGYRAAEKASKDNTGNFSSTETL